MVIVESPAKAKTIQGFLGKGYVVKSSFGHIRDLDEHSLSVDIKNGFKPEYVIPAEKQKTVADLKKAAASAKMVWLASDEDREGEAISWHLVQALGLDEKETKRIVFHEITKTAIENAIKNPRGINLNLVDAQQARRVLDRLVGFELSPVLWKKVRRGLSAGRVQSVALRLVVEKEREIMSFETSPHYRVQGLFETSGVRVKGTLETKFNKFDDARAFLEDSIGATYKVDSTEKKEGSKHPAPPFTTSTLQQEAARKLHFSVNQTMRVAQSLYERGLITYMRTDSTNLSLLAIKNASQFILHNFGEEYSHSRQYKTKSKGAQEAHEAIRPTNVGMESIEGTAQEMKLYNLIWKRTLASQMADAKILNTKVKLSSDKRKEKFALQATEVVFDGFLKLYLESKDDEMESEDNPAIPSLNKGDIVNALEIKAECKFSQPPYRYTEASLVKKLEELGIGRPSTYAPTINTLTAGRGYIFKSDILGKKVEVTNLTLKNSKITQSSETESIGAERGKLVPQEIGMMVSDYLVEHFPDVMDYTFTANVEKDFDSVAAGNKQWNSVIENFYGNFHKQVEQTISTGEFARSERVLGIDPEDGKEIVVKSGRFGPYVQKGEGDDKRYAGLEKGQLIESITLEEAIALLRFPRLVGKIDGVDVIVAKGRYGPYIKYGTKNISLNRGSNPQTISLEECRSLIQSSKDSSTRGPLKEFKEEDISIIIGPYGPYLKHAGKNFKLPKDVNPETLELEECLNIIKNTSPSSKRATRKK